LHARRPPGLKRGGPEGCTMDAVKCLENLGESVLWKQVDDEGLEEPIDQPLVQPRVLQHLKNAEKPLFGNGLTDHTLELIGQYTKQFNFGLHPRAQPAVLTPRTGLGGENIARPPRLLEILDLCGDLL
jgi:hypothetical protein